MANKYKEYTKDNYICPFCQIEIKGGYEGFKNHYFDNDKSKHCTKAV